MGANSKVTFGGLQTLRIARPFKLINQLDGTVSPVYYLTFVYSSTCFGLLQLLSSWWWAWGSPKLVDL